MPNSGKWDGITERRLKTDDHDTLIQLVTILNSHVKNFDSHVTDDKESFNVMNKKADFATKMIYIAMGGLGVLQIIIGLIKH